MKSERLGLGSLGLGLGLGLEILVEDTCSTNGVAVFFRASPVTIDTQTGTTSNILDASNRSCSITT